MKRPRRKIDSDEPVSSEARGCGTLLIVGGLLVVGSLIWSGIGVLFIEEPSMGHVNQIGGTIFCGLPALWVMICGLHLRRHGRW